MQKWEYLFVEVVAASGGGSIHYRLNGVDHETDELDWKNRTFFNRFGSQGWELIAAVVRDAELSVGGLYVFKRPLNPAGGNL